MAVHYHCDYCGLETSCMKMVIDKMEYDICRPCRESMMKPLRGKGSYAAAIDADKWVGVRKDPTEIWPKITWGTQTGCCGTGTMLTGEAVKKEFIG